MRVGIDAITPGLSLLPGAGGMRPYLTGLVDTMSRLDPSVEYVVFENPHAPLHELAGLPNVHRAVCRGLVRDRRARVLYQNTMLPLLLRAWKLDVTLGTHNVVPLGSPRPFVVVVQSLQYYTQAAAYGRLRATYLRLAVQASLRRADAVITVSQFEKDEAARLTGVPADKMHVVHPVLFAIGGGQAGGAAAGGAAAGGAAAGGADRDRSPEGPYILAISTLYQFKNIPRLIEAYALLRREHQVPQRLRIIGGDADVTAASLHQYATDLGVAGWVDFLGRVDHALVSQHYASADVFVYPSLYETFGHPPLEAMTIGCPVVAARASSIPEVVGDAAELVDPLDARDMARGLFEVLSHPERRVELVRRGRERVKLFTKEGAARRTLDVLRQTRDRYVASSPAGRTGRATGRA